MAKRKKKLEPQLQWMRGLRDETEVSKRMTWRSRCDCYKVQESVSKVGFATTYYALHKDDTGWFIIDRNKTRKAAEKACEEHRMNIR